MTQKSVQHTPQFMRALNLEEWIIDISTGVNIIVGLIAALSAIYASRSAKQAEKSNYIGRLNALLALRLHYLELIGKRLSFMEQFKDTEGGEKAFESFANLDSKLRQVNKEIESYHDKVVK
ncbi:hypothetical protein Q4488_01630 [Amphritea sp. 1_MG-2023]|uniref:hypothetical protein n=1 Tax=Amphritea sp. 1_MG-2023 TaxID=3062670 RepID=UPI0026E41A30|nr:hypothetical protein [Amphritea sp. 1_MG-2023]MDO6562069.1 hypothetical protein [Amphritea sp. 1_MG-2023]